MGSGALSGRAVSERVAGGGASENGPCVDWRKAANTAYPHAKLYKSLLPSRRGQRSKGGEAV